MKKERFFVVNFFIGLNVYYNMNSSIKTILNKFIEGE
jgi:hypothetical protein